MCCKTTWHNKPALAVVAHLVVMAYLKPLFRVYSYRVCGLCMTSLGLIRVGIGHLWKNSEQKITSVGGVSAY